VSLSYTWKKKFYYFGRCHLNDKNDDPPETANNQKDPVDWSNLKSCKLTPTFNLLPFVLTGSKETDDEALKSLALKNRRIRENVDYAFLDFENENDRPRGTTFLLLLVR
jgi:hypothetical protein